MTWSLAKLLQLPIIGKNQVDQRLNISVYVECKIRKRSLVGFLPILGLNVQTLKYNFPSDFVRVQTIKPKIVQM
jgi:hypothetical protein